MKKRQKPKDDDNGFKEFGGYMQAKINKLEDQFTSDVTTNMFQKTTLFNGISVIVNGLTNPSADEIKRIMMTNGGIYHTYQRSTTTFIIANNLPDVKIRNLKNTNASPKYISPQWITDCLKENRILHYSKYLLYTNCKTSQPKIQFVKSTESDNIDSGIKIINVNDDNNNNNNDIIHLDSNNESDNSEDDNFDSENFYNIETKLNAFNDMMKEQKLFNDNNEEIHKEQKNSNNEILKNNSARTAVDPNFITEFYNNSRLHHIATLGATFKNYISELRDKHNGDFPDRSLLKSSLTKLNWNKNDDVNITESAGKLIMHIDMDCFFVSVGLRSRRHLIGQPVAVTHSKGRKSGAILNEGVDRQKEFELYKQRFDKKIIDNIKGDVSVLSNTENENNSMAEIASCNYEARKMGIKNGMFVGPALKLCPQLQTIPYDFDAYKEVAFTLYNTIIKYTLDIEAVSCDEMYVDLTELINELKISFMDFVAFIRNEIKIQTKCSSSAGIGSNRLQARMATKKAKPNGQYYLKPDNVNEYFKNIEISDLPGVGYTTTYKLNKLNWKTCEDLQKITLNKLQNEFGKKFGETLYQYCRGIDNRPLVFGQIRKSVSAEINYGIRFTSEIELDNFLKQLCTEVHSRLMECKKMGKAITLKYMIRSKEAPIETAKFMGHGVCDHVTKTITLQNFTNNFDLIMKTIFSIKTMLNIDPKELRGIGIQITKFNENHIERNEEPKNSLRLLFNKITEKNKTNLENETITKIDNNSNNVSSSTIDLTIETNNYPEIKRIITRSFGKKDNNSNINNNNNNIKNKNEPIIKAIPKGKKNPNNNVAQEQSADIYDGFDMNVFNELPEDIRQEILDERYADQKNKPNANGTNEKKNLKKPTTKQKTVKQKNTDEPAFIDINNIDADFLAAMPPDILAEFQVEQQKLNNKNKTKNGNKNQQKQNNNINNEHSEMKEPQNNNVNTTIQNNNNSNNNNINNDKMQTETESIEITNAIALSTEELKQQHRKISDNNILQKKDWKQILQSWLCSTSNPENYDIELLALYAIEFITVNMLNEIYLCFRYLFRIIKDGNFSCEWHRAYKTIIDLFQKEMYIVYKSKLMVLTEFECNKCQCK